MFTKVVNLIKKNNNTLTKTGFFISHYFSVTRSFRNHFNMMNCSKWFNLSKQINPGQKIYIDAH